VVHPHAPKDGGNPLSPRSSTEPAALERRTIDIIPLDERHGKPRDLFIRRPATAPEPARNLTP
jgi:hypothetical protein